MPRRQIAYQLVGGLLGIAVGVALTLLISYLTAGALWAALLAMILSGGTALAGLYVGNELYRRGRGES